MSSIFNRQTSQDRKNELKEEMDLLLSNKFRKRYKGLLKINSWYVNMWIFTIALGMFQFGFSMSIMNQFTLTLCDFFYDGKCEIGKQIFNSLVTVAVPFGALIGSNIGGYAIRIGSRRALIIVNFILIFIIGRFIYGTTTGLFETIGSVFVREISPKASSGTYGGINEFMVTFGIMIASIIGFAVPRHDNSLYWLYWIILMGFPVLISIAQLLLLIFVFKSESPLFYKCNGQLEEEEHEAIKLIYRDADEAMKILSHEDSLMISIKSFDYDHKLKVLEGPKNFRDLLKNPFRPAFIIGCIVAVITQLTGINAVIFYSSYMFAIKKDNSDQSYELIKIGNMMVGIVNCLASVLGIYFLTVFGRRDLLYNGMIGMSISLSLLAFLNNTQFFLILFSCIFIFFYEASIGSIVMLYVAEIMTPRGAGFAFGLNWIFVILFAILPPFTLGSEKQQNTYLGFCICCSLGILFSLLFVKETKGLSSYQCKKLYFPSNKLNETDECIEKLQSNTEFDSLSSYNYVEKVNSSSN